LVVLFCNDSVAKTKYKILTIMIVIDTTIAVNTVFIIF
jgi:hypothetical protein